MWLWAYGLQSTDPRKLGTVRVNSDYIEGKKPLGIILLRSLGSAVLIGCGYAMLVPALPLPWWQRLTVATGVLMMYVGLAFFFRPEPNTDEMGWCGGLVDDPFAYHDGWNRFLWNLHCILGPGRFVAETFLDLCGLCGLVAVEAPATLDDDPTLTGLSQTPSHEPILVAQRFQGGDEREFGRNQNLSRRG